MSGGKPRISNVKPSARDRNKPAVRSVADQKNSARRRISSVAMNRNVEARNNRAPKSSVGATRIPGVLISNANSKSSKDVMLNNSEPSMSSSSESGSDDEMKSKAEFKSSNAISNSSKGGLKSSAD